MELILFAAVSVIIARWFEKRYVIAAAAHSILFLIFGLCLLYCSDCDVIVSAMKSMSGEVVYEYIRYALNAPLDIFFFSYSAYLIVNTVMIFMLIAVSAAVTGQIIHRAVSGHNKLLIKDNDNKGLLSFFLGKKYVNKERKYIKYCRILS
ncbi:MAG: hypothetical protein PHW77_07580 [Eubacteriales bacterium]|nr:hypothetical protein [Eubacteriales bacterium]